MNHKQNQVSINGDQCKSETSIAEEHIKGMTDIAHYVINHDLEPAKTRGNEQNIAHFRFA